MCQAKQCFSERAQASLAQMKKDLAHVRMPVAKMEALGKSVPIDSLRNPAGPPESGSDMQVGDPSDPRSLRELMNQFYGVVTQIDHSDVLAPHESSYHRPGTSAR